MPNPALPSRSACALVRAHFGLTQAELARWLGVSAGMVAHLETGRKPLSLALARRLRPLELLLPPAAGGLGPEPPPPPDPLDLTTPAPAALPPAPPLEAAPLRARLRRVRYLAGKARFELEGRQMLAGQAARRAWGLGVLAALLAPEPGTGPVPAPLAPDPALRPAEDARWLARLRADTAPPPLTPTRRALLALRLHLLLEEAAALEALLAAPGSADAT
ncbi:helix-turn-helix transcriptional regulator [Hymenobacter rubripertinctus]|nr:helix-turn-helix transcriptional regulator [Hymenobacter rubripertinctus]